MCLDDLLKEFQITGLTEEEKDHWNRVWHRLKPWPDSVAGLARLKKKYTIAPLSNGNVSLLADMAKKKNLDQATIAYNQVTTRCVECHKYVRQVQLAANRK